jgi:hypothetical protein
MTMPSPAESSDFDSFVADMLHGTASAETAAQLEHLLSTDPTRRAAYLDQALLHGQLAATPLAAGIGDRSATEMILLPAERLSQPRGRWPTTGNLFRGTLVVLAAGAMFLLVRTDRDPGSNVEPHPDRAVMLPDRHGSLAGAYDIRQLPAEAVGRLAQASADATPLVRTTLAAATRSSRLRTAQGADVELHAPGVFGLVSGDAGALFRGSVRARLTRPDQSYSVETANLRIVDLGTEFQVHRIDEDRLAVTVLDGEVEVQSRLRLPLVHWSFATFANPDRTATDLVQGIRAVAGMGVESVVGLVGRAAAFGNKRGASFRVEGGTGERVGTGLFSFSTGISIEALIIPAWSGASLDYDEIWRKEDGNSRVLLSLQNDGTKNASFSVPPVKPGPCLSFGLQLTQPGGDHPRYDELDMPLDGKEGRPTLAALTDGRPHHVVATYDSFTGIKSIFIDGERLFSHVYPTGSLIVSGGPEPAYIGSHRDTENFTGTIDELSLYDFALTASDVAEHYRRLLAGRSAVPLAGLPNGETRHQHWAAVTRLSQGESRVFNQHSGLPEERTTRGGRRAADSPESADLPQ